MGIFDLFGGPNFKKMAETAPNKIGVYLIKNEWIDIGHIEDFYKAQLKYQGDYCDK